MWAANEFQWSERGERRRTRAIGNRAGRQQRSEGSWRKHWAVRVINGPSRAGVAAREAVSGYGQRANSPNWARAA